MSEKGSQAAEDTSDREMVVTRTINAPREVLFDLWSDPTHLARWWGPRGFTTTTYAMDFRVGGVWRYVMHGPDGTDYQNRVTYTEMSRPALIAFAHDDGADTEGMSHSNRVTFEEAGGGKTKVTMRLLFKSAAIRDLVVKKYGAEKGGRENLERLEEFSATGSVADEATQFVVTRQFDAPREVVFDAWTDGEKLGKWWGPKGFEMGVHKLDLRPGGMFHYSMKGNGMEMWGKFVYREIVRPEKLVYVVSFSDATGGVQRHPFGATWPLEMLNIATFSEYEGKTTLTLRGEPINATEAEVKTYLDGRGGMRQGFKGTLDQLEAFLAGGE